MYGDRSEVASSNTPKLYFFVCFFSNLFIYIHVIHNHFQTILVAEYRFYGI